MFVILRAVILFVLIFPFCIQTVIAQDQTVFPKLTGYFGIMHPIVTFTKTETLTNFDESYTVAFPTGINILKSDRIGFSFEIVPVILAQDSESKVEKFVFHPGIIFRFKNGFSFTARLAFESNGRYGFTPVLTKVIRKYKSSSIYLSAVSPARFGNSTDSSLGLGMQVGLAF